MSTPTQSQLGCDATTARDSADANRVPCELCRAVREKSKDKREELEEKTWVVENERREKP